MMGFAGMERDTVTGLNLAVNRVENPGTGRWTSQDPMGICRGRRKFLPLRRKRRGQLRGWPGLQHGGGSGGGGVPVVPILPPVVPVLPPDPIPPGPVEGPGPH